MKKKPTTRKPRGIRFDDAEWLHLEKKGGKNGTPSDACRALVRADMKKSKK